LVRLYEYQGKQLPKEAAVAVPDGDIASTPPEAARIAKKIASPVTIKAQIWATGRFKAGGIRFADNPQEAEKAASDILGREIKGNKVQKVLVEERLQIEREYYAGVIVDAIMANQEQWHHAHGIVKALREDLVGKPGFPVLLLLCGNKEKESLEILKEGLRDLSIRLEMYGSERVYDTDFLAKRMRTMIDEYRKERRAKES